MDGEGNFYIKIMQVRSGKMLPFTKICKLTGWDEGRLRPVLWSDRFVLLERVKDE